MASVLTINNLSKNYGSIKALQNVSFDVPAGSIFGILGPNGSGKTTLLGIVMDVLKATSGSFSWNGSTNNDAMRKQIGTLLETPNFYHYLSAEANLKIAAKIKERGEADIDEVLKTVNLYQRKTSAFNTFSLGMKQRLAIASALLGNPDILVFDEPTNGLDPAGIAEIRELIKRLSKQGKTIIMASHILDEVEKVCTHVAIIQKGVLKTVSRVDDIMSTASNGTTENNIVIEISCQNNILLKDVLSKHVNVKTIEEVEGCLSVTFSAFVDAAAINKYCFENNIILNKLVTKTKSLEAKFLEITGKQSG